MPVDVNAGVIDFDNDAVEIVVRGKTYRMLAADEVDEVTLKTEQADEKIDPAHPLPTWLDKDGEWQTGTYGQGDPFIGILREHLSTKHGIVVGDSVALVIWSALRKKAAAYQLFFGNGPSSPSSSDSPHPPSSADEAAEKLLSITQSVSALLSALPHSTTASATEKAASAT